MTLKLITGKYAAQCLADYSSQAGHTKNEFSDTILSLHRTNQQDVMRLLLVTIKEWSVQIRYDLRNEATIMKSKKIIESLSDNIYLPRI